MLITSVVKKGSLVAIELDKNEEIKIVYDIFVKNGLRKNDELSKDDIDRLLRENDLYRVKQTALNLLARRLHSEREIRDKLYRKKIPSDIINETISFLKEKEYLNDKEFARCFVEEKINRRKMGLSNIKAHLIKKGVSREIIESETAKHQNNAALLKNALEQAAKKNNFLSLKNLEPAEKKLKLYGFLKNKGYSHDIIYSVLEKMDLSD